MNQNMSGLQTHQEGLCTEIIKKTLQGVSQGKERFITAENRAENKTKQNSYPNSFIFLGLQNSSETEQKNVHKFKQF